MRERDVKLLETRIEHLLVMADSVDDERLKAEITKYLFILMCSYLEMSIRRVVHNFTNNRSHRHVTHYVDATLQNLYNPNMERIVQLAARFNSDLSDRVRNDLDGSMADAIDSVVAVRRQAAHGMNVGATLVSAAEYYSSLQRAIGELSRIFR
jgi:hypothetical protein